ncbi:MAG TPA: ABC transporter transmembrane domain-containing protein, partial [Chloroflexia bacterium]|nr:ABC transporter transmembrane domain-containing protein [Chloroflexia bacterium]
MAASPNLQATLPGFGRLLRRFWPAVRRQRRTLIGALLALLAEVLLRLLEPWPLKLVFDRVIPTAADPLPSGLPLIDALDPGLLLILAAASTVALTALRALAEYANTVGFSLVGNNALAQVRAQVYSHLQRLSLAFHTQARSGDLIVRVIGDVSQLKDVAVTALLPLLVNLLILVGMLGLMAWMNWQLTLLALSVLPLFWLTTLRLGPQIQAAARKQRKREGAMAATAAEALGAIRIVQALSLEDRLAETFFSQNKDGLKQDAKAAKLSASLERSVDVVIALGTGLVLWYGAQLVLRAALTPGDLLVFLTYLKNAFKPVRDFAKYTGRLAKALAAGERVADLLEREPDVRNLPGAVPAPPLQGGVAFDRVDFAYQPGHPVLRGIQCTVPPGRHVALVGPSGHGKTTLLSLLLRLYDPTQGRVLLDGQDIRAYTLESVRAQISVVMQDTILFAASVRDNIAYGVPEASEEDIVAAARLASAHEFIQALPEGYDTVLGERGATLSNGQRQRIAIARAAIRRAPIVILDEPTTGLDETNARQVMDALDRLIAGRTAFLITHELSYAERADLVLVLEDGRLMEQGGHAELLRRGGLYARWYGLQAQVGEDRAWDVLVDSAPPAASAGTDATEPAHGTPRDDAAQPLPAPIPVRRHLAGVPKSPVPAPPRGGVRRRMVGLAGLGLALMGGLLALTAGASRGAAGPIPAGAPTIAAAAAPTSSPLSHTPATAAASPTTLAPAAGGSPTPEDAPPATEMAVISRTVAGAANVLTFSGPLTGVNALAWARDNRTLALGSADQRVRVLDTATGQVTLLAGHTGAVYQVAWAPDGETLASGGADGTVRLWTAAGRPLATLTGTDGL